jgi:hypothetical protein
VVFLRGLEARIIHGLLDPVEPFELSLQTTFSSNLYSPMRRDREASQRGIRSLFVIASSSYSPCKMKQVVNSSKWRQDHGRLDTNIY